MQLQELIKRYEKTIDFSTFQQLSVYQSKKNSLLNYIKPTTNISKITSDKIADYINYLQTNGNKANTIRAKVSYLKTLLMFALQNNYLVNIPYIKPPKKVIPEKAVIPMETLLQMLKYCKVANEYELRRILLIGYYTGMRIDNILNLTPKQIDNNYIRIWQNKTDTPYSIPIKKRLLIILSNFKPFTMNYQQIYYAFNKMKNKLHLADNITIHSLRHTFCTRLVQKGINIKVIQQLANHKSIATTALYLHIKNKDLENAISML